MCSTDFGMLDLLFEKEDLSCKSLDGFRNTLFSCSERVDSLDVKEEVLDSGTIDWKMASDWDADELLRSVLDGNDMSSGLDNPTLGSVSSSTASTLSTSTLTTPTLEASDDMDSLENLVGLPFHTILDSGASDSGMSSDSSLDQQLSPLSGYSVASPGSLGDMGLGLGLASPDPAQDATSDVSSISDLGSLGSTSPDQGGSSSSTVVASPSSPDAILGLDDFIQTDSGFSSPVPHQTTVAETVAPAVTPVVAAASPSATAATVVTSSIPTFITRPAATAATTTTQGGKVTSVSVAAASSSVPLSTTTPTNVSAPVLKTVTVAAASPASTVGGQTIVVTQASKGTPNAHLVRGGTLLKTGSSSTNGNSQASRSILLPVTVKDLNQVRTIKIISTGGSGGVNGRGGVRTVVSTVRTPSTTTTLNNQQSVRTALLGAVRSHESKSLLKGGATTTVLSASRPATTTISSTHTSPTRVKVEPRDDDDDDCDEQHNGFQQLTLSDEEKRLLKKEGILLPSHYPLTKQEERELKRIRRKIRNKISAQDSRKRKKEYIDGLEDRVKACTEENQQLQKRIRTLEAQNESLLVQMRRFQNAVTGGRSQAHASTALMMLILSAALFLVPSLRQDGTASDTELSVPVSKMPSAGHSRSLLEAGDGAIVPGTLEVLEGVDDELVSELEKPLVQALTDHDYTPVAKRQRTLSKSPGYYVPPLDDFPPQHGKPDSGGGFPPDDGSDSKLSARIMDTMVDHISNNYSDPGGKHDSNSQAVVVNLGQGRKRLRDDLELE